jgi:hypothetical protein
MDYPSRDDDFRAATCSTCHTRRRDEYLEQKGEPVSQARRARQLTKARQVVKKALQARIQGEKRKEQWLDTRKRWEQGEFIQATQGDIMSFQKGPEYYEGPYRQWVGYSDPWEVSISASDAWDGLQGESEAREGLQRGSEGWSSLQREREDSMGESEAWEGSTDGGESFTDRQDGWGVLQVKVKVGTVHKGGVRAGTVGKGSRTSLWISLWVSLQVALRVILLL